MSFLGDARAWGSGIAKRWRGAGAIDEARRQEALVGLALRALEGADSNDLITHAAMMVARILDVPYSAALVWEPEERSMRVQAGVGWRAGVVGRLVIDTASLPQAGEAWRGWEPVVFDDLASDPRMADVPLLRSHEIVSGLSVVIVPRGRPFGALAVYAGKRRVFQPSEIAFVHEAAKILAIALGREYGERALFEEMQMSTVLAHVGRELMSCADVPVLLVRICELTAQALHCDHSVTWLHQEDADGFRPVAADGLPGVQWETLGSVVLPMDGVTALLHDLAERETVRIAVPSQRHALLSALLERSGIRRAVFAAIHKGEHVIGLQMSGHRDRGSEFGLQDERVAHGVAQLASMALMKARVVEELERASQLKSEFVSTMSHELRTPLNIIIGYTDMLRDAASPEDQAPLLGLVRKASHELLEMIDATLNLNRLAAGGDVACFAPMSTVDLWREMAADFAAIKPTGEAVLRWQDGGPLEIHTDRRKLKIVLKNLIGNALKFTATGEVVAAYERVGDQVRFTIRDTGIGIPPEALPHVFDMFRQVDSSETRSYSGAGLGLYIVKSLLSQLGGQVQVESVVGQGSIFTVVVPIEQGAERGEPEVLAPQERQVELALAVAPPSAPDDCSLHARRRLLFADDLPLNRFLVQRFIAREFRDVEVLEACDGEQAVAMFDERAPHLVLMDLHMPNLDGWQAAHRIRQRPGGRDVPILALSVDASPNAEANAVRAGFQEFIAKPIGDYSALKARLEFWLGGREARRPPTDSATPSPTCEQCRREAKSATAA